jgi:hypothetical protein
MKKIWLVLLPSFLLSFFTDGAQKLIIFSHGTCGSAIQIPDLLNKKSKLDVELGPFTKRRQAAYREHPLAFENQILGRQGLTIITQEDVHAWMNGKMPDVCNKGVFPLIYAYESIARVIAPEEQRVYGVYGWSGILTHKARVEAAEMFYEAVCDYRDSQDATLSIEVIVHSHAGNVMLALPLIEKNKKRGLSIDLLHMMGTPIQQETIEGIYSPLFKTIVCGHSKKDLVTTNDHFSTEGKSKLCLADVVDPAKLKTIKGKRIDLEYRYVKNNGKKKTIDHANMWFLRRSGPLFSQADELPLLPFISCFNHLLRAIPENIHLISINGSISEKKDFIHVRVCYKSKPLSHMIDQQVLQELSATIKKNWQPIDSSRSVIFNKHNHFVLKLFWQDIFRRRDD